MDDAEYNKYHSLQYSISIVDGGLDRTTQPTVVDDYYCRPPYVVLHDFGWQWD